MLAAHTIIKMLIVKDKGTAIVLMLVSLFIVGTFPALLTLLERRGRLPQHTFLDYSITNLLTAIVIAFPFGQAGGTKPGMPTFLTQLTEVRILQFGYFFTYCRVATGGKGALHVSCHGGEDSLSMIELRIHDNWPSVLFAMASGLVLGLGNLIAQYAWAFAGLTVTNIICSSMTVVLGTTINYFLDGRINRAEILFPGVACFLAAVFLGAAVHSSNTKDNEQKLSMSVLGLTILRTKTGSSSQITDHI